MKNLSLVFLLLVLLDTNARTWSALSGFKSRKLQAIKVDMHTRKKSKIIRCKGLS